MNGGGAPRWNDETQRWETGGEAPQAAPPPLPASPPVAPGTPVGYPGATGVPQQPPVPPQGTDAPPQGTPVPPQGADVPPQGTDAAPESGYVYGPDGRGGFAGGFVGGFVGTVESGGGEGRPDGRPGGYPDGHPYGPGPGSGPGGTDEGPGTLWQRLTPLTAGLTVGVLAACTAALWFTLARDDDGRAAQGASSASSAATSSGVSDGGAAGSGEAAGGSADAEPTGEGGAPTDGASPPAEAGPGYAPVHDEDGFSVVVPEEWRNRSKDDHGVYYKSADGTSLIQIWRVVGSGSALDAVRAASESRSASPGFQQISLDSVTTPDGGDAAELVYAYDYEASGTRRQVLDRVFTASDGHLYALLVAAPDTQWPLHREILDEAVAGFDPTGSSL